MINGKNTVRALFRAVKAPNAPSPYDTIQLKVYYPAKASTNDKSKGFGGFVPNTEQAPFPVVIFFNGINCSPDSYEWLAVDIATQGLIVVTFAWIAENLPGVISLTPGVNVQGWLPDNYGKVPTASALPALLSELETLQNQGVLSGLLDLQRVILGGHSAGGRVAIESASPAFYPQLRGAFAYGSHTAAGVNLGYEPGTILPLPDSLPLLLMGGTKDGVIANNSHYYGVTWEEPTTPILRTFQAGISGGRGDSYLVLLEGANHFAIAHPQHSTTATSFLDFPMIQPEAETRAVIAAIARLFIQEQLGEEQALQTFLSSNQPLIASSDWK